MDWFNFTKLTHKDIDDIGILEQNAMNTETTFPFTKKEIIELFEKDGDYIAYGYKKESSLISKVGFTKTAGNKYELDIWVLPEYQGKWIWTKILNQSIQQLLIEIPSAKIFLMVHPQNPALKLYKRLWFESHKTEDNSPKIQQTEHWPRITMDYKTD